MRTAIVLAVLLLALPARAQDGLVTYKSLGPEVALAEIASISQPGMPQSGLHTLPGVVAIGGLTDELAPRPGSRRCGTESSFEAQYTTTLLMLSPACIRSNALLMSDSGIVWVIIGSI
jgi:hypothetical protein